MQANCVVLQTVGHGSMEHQFMPWLLGANGGQWQAVSFELQSTGQPRERFTQKLLPFPLKHEISWVPQSCGHGASEHQFKPVQLSHSGGEWQVYMDFPHATGQPCSLGMQKSASSLLPQVTSVALQAGGHGTGEQKLTPASPGRGPGILHSYSSLLQVAGHPWSKDTQ